MSHRPFAPEGTRAARLPQSSKPCRGRGAALRACGDDRRLGDGLHRFDGRRHRRADHPEGPRRRHRRDAVGGQRLPADAGRAHPGRRRARRPHRPAARLPHRHRAVHGRLARLRRGAERGAPDRGARDPGDRRGAAGAAEPGDHLGQLSQGHPRPGDRHLGGGLGGDHGARAADRRLPHRSPVVAGGLLDQPAAGGGRAVAHLAASCRKAATTARRGRSTGRARRWRWPPSAH